MKVFLNGIYGIDDAIISMHMSKRSWTKKLQQEIQTEVKQFNETGVISPALDAWINILVKLGWKHTTLLRFVNFSCTVQGMHRGGQDDWDSHAQRFNNRIIRASTRLADFDNDCSEWYEDKIIPTDTALCALGIATPPSITYNGEKFCKVCNGYVREDLIKSKDVLRGLYMLSIPSNFIFQCDITEYSHIYKMRGYDGEANPEVQKCCETIAELIQKKIPQFNKDLLLKIKN